MHPTQAPYIQWLAYTNQKLPTLMIFIALDNDQRDNVDEVIAGRRGGGVLSLMSDVVIHGSDEMRSWFAQYMKLMQQKVHNYTLYMHGYMYTSTYSCTCIRQVHSTCTCIWIIGYARVHVHVCIFMYMY